jgi:endonuclease/exonuclease/phosphatase family metal-dependent hydrolase
VRRGLSAIVLLLWLSLPGCTSANRLVWNVPGLACRRVVPDPERVVRWISPSAESDRARLTAWCAAVGPVRYQPQPGDGADQTAAVDRLAIVAWNTHVGGGDLDAVIEQVRSGEFTNGERFPHIVLLLQETYRSGDGVPVSAPLHARLADRIEVAPHATHERDIRQVAERHRMALLYVPSMRNGAAADDPEDRGNAILSTIPVSQHEIIELPFEHQRRVVAAAVIAGSNTRGTPWRLRIATVHLDTALALTRGGPMAARQNQAVALIGAMDNADTPTIVAGDFNSWIGEREPAIATLRGAFPDAPHSHAPTWIGPFGLRAKLDYVLARGTPGFSRLQRLPSRFGSDHFPLLGVVDFS